MSAEAGKLTKRMEKMREKIEKVRTTLTESEELMTETEERTRRGTQPERLIKTEERKPLFSPVGTPDDVAVKTVLVNKGTPYQTGNVPAEVPTTQDAMNERTLRKHYKDPYSMAAAYAQACIGYGEFDIDLSNEEQREMFEIAQTSALIQQNYNNYMKQQALMNNSYRFRGNPQFLSFEQWTNITTAREMAQLKLKIAQETRNNAYMKMGQLEEQKRRNEWFDYHYPPNPQFI